MSDHRHPKSATTVIGGRLAYILRVAAAMALGIPAANGTTVLDISSSLNASDPTQFGRILRDGIPSDWSIQKTFPGVVSPDTSYLYQAFDVPIGAERYFEITFNDLSLTANDFVSAYGNSYNPGAGLGVNYLGDAGFSGNYFPDNTSPIFFQILAPASVTRLVIVVNDASTGGGGIGAPFEVVVNSYLDTNYNSVPEPSTAAIFFGGGLLLCLVGLARRRKSSTEVLRMRSFAGWLVLITLASLPLPAESTSGIGTAAAQQISDILRDKRRILKLNPKLDLNLYFASKRAQGQLAGKSYVKAVSPQGVDGRGMITVIIRGTLTSALQSKISGLGGKVLQNLPKFSYARVQVPLAAVESLSTMSGVSRIGMDEQARTNALVTSLRLAPRGQPRQAISLALSQYFSRAGLNFFVGALTSQGVVAHRANQTFPLGVNGTGVRVGVLSDSASPGTIAALIATGDLPVDVTILPGQAGAGTDEGAAMMEIVHDLAPEAKLYFATAFNGSGGFADNILNLRNVYGCDIIVDDVTYLNEGAFQDGPIAQAVNEVVANGALYFSSSANSGNITRGTSGTWEGDFRNGGAVDGTLLAAGETGFYHNFGTLVSPQTYDNLTAITDFITLQWADPLGASANDYDLFILNSTGAVVKGFSAGSQSGTEDPFEIIGPGMNCGTPTAIGYCSAAGDRIVAVLFDGLPRALRVDTNGGRLALATSGSTFGHNAAQSTVCMAAVYWNSAGKGAEPFTGGTTNPIEPFSSDGPRKIFFHPDGTPITPGNFLFATSGGRTLQKPDFAAADGVSTKTPGFLPFFGTSAAAPHAAAIAALVKSARPGYTNVQIYRALKATTLDDMAIGPDRNSGYGILNALSAVKYAQSH